MSRPSKSKLRVLHITHPSLLPPDSLEGFTPKQINVWKTDYDVVSTLREMGHEVESVGVDDELQPVVKAVRALQPDIVFNLVEGFAGLPELDQHVVAYLELLGVPYTGCNPRGLVLARGKALSKKIVHYHRIPTPAFNVMARRRKVRRRRGLDLPVIVKSLVAESSIGISQASVVDTDEKLAERVAFIHDNLATDAIAEQFIEGRELYVGVLGNERLKVLPVWEMTFENMPPGSAAIATERVKHDIAYQKRRGIFHQPAVGLPDSLAQTIVRTSKRIYRILGLDGYARIDYRLSADGQLYFLEANPNPEIARSEEFACSAADAGLPYDRLIRKIVALGLGRRSAAAGL